jgi:large subunit ribosomal protein L25
MEVSRARRLVSLLPPKLLNFFIRYPPRNPAYRTLYSKEDKSLLIARNLHDFLPIPPTLYTPTVTTTPTSHGTPKPTIYLPFQNPFKPTRDPRSGKVHGPRYSLRRQADIIKLAIRFGVAELLPPCAKMNKLLYGKKRPMAGTLHPKGTYEERTRHTYVEKKQKSLEEALRIVAMRKTVLYSLHPGSVSLIGSGGQLKRVENGNLVLQRIRRNDTLDSNDDDMHCTIILLSPFAISHDLELVSMIILLMETFSFRILLLPY